MDNVTFTRELNKYKVIRLADHTKIRWKTQRVRNTSDVLVVAIVLPHWLPWWQADGYSSRLHLSKRCCSMSCMWSTLQKPESKPKLLSAPNASNGKALLAKEGTDEDFYKLFQRINANALSEKDMARLIVAMKEVTSSDYFIQFQRIDFFS